MNLILLLIIPVGAGLIGWIVGNRKNFARWITLLGALAELALASYIWASTFGKAHFFEQGYWLDTFHAAWVPQLGISFHLAVDGFGLLMVLLSAFLGVISVLVSWTEIQRRVAFFHFNLMWVLSAIIGVFMALDLFLFYFLWEMMLVPMYLLIGVWGHEHRRYASLKFYLFTQTGDLLLLLGILGLYFVHYHATGILSFDYVDLIATPMTKTVGRWLMLGFFVSFAVKLPAFPLQPWLADAHTEAPTGGSVDLAGLSLKTAAYGYIRFVIPLFPEAASWIAEFAMILGVIGILYGAILSFAQTDFKRLVAYTSVSHLGFILLGIFAFNELAIQGSIMLMICHGLSTGALFILAGWIQEHTRTRDMDRFGGLWKTTPRMGGMAMVFALASLGLPGFGNFIGEFLILIGVYGVNVPLAILGAGGLVAATVYSLWLIQRTFHGEPREEWVLPDLHVRHMIALSSMAIVLIWFGVYPMTVLETSKPPVQAIERLMSAPVFGESPAGHMGHPFMDADPAIIPSLENGQ